MALSTSRIIYDTGTAKGPISTDCQTPFHNDPVSGDKRFPFLKRACVLAITEQTDPEHKLTKEDIEKIRLWALVTQPFNLDANARNLLNFIWFQLAGAIENIPISSIPEHDPTGKELQEAGVKEKGTNDPIGAILNFLGLMTKLVTNPLAVMAILAGAALIFFSLYRQAF